jgi:hypothetical protein
MSDQKENRLPNTGAIAHLRTLNGDRGFKIAEAAALMTISTRTLRREIERGNIATVQMSPRRVMILESEIARRINEGTRHAAKLKTA